MENRLGRHRDERSTNLLRLIPLFQTGLDFLASLFGGHRAIHDCCTYAPEFILEVGFTARKNLVGVTNRRFALLSPAKELVSQRIIQGHLSIAEGEEAWQRIRIECGKFIRGDPAQECLRLFRMRRLGVHTHRNVSMITDIARIASIFNIWLEDAKIETGIFFKLTDFP